MTEHEPFLQPFEGTAEVLRSIIEPVLDGLGLELVQMFLVRGPHRDNLRLFVERKDVSAGGVAMGEIEKASRVVSDLLDVEDAQKKLFPHRWDLELGSPGLDRALTKKSHFAQAVGQTVKLKLRGHNKKSLTGTLVQAADALVVTEGGARVELGWDDVVSAQVVFKFEEPQNLSKQRLPKGKHKHARPQ